MQKGPIIIKTALISASEAAGVYQMFDENNVILYIGKAKNIKNRLKNYISNQLTTRIINLISNVARVECIATANESEALLLEGRLIKIHQPKYNVLLKDDKSFPYLKVRTDHEFPQIVKYRGKLDMDGKYFGPFANVGEVNKVLGFLHKTFRLRNCTDSYFAARTRPCLQYQIGRCSAPCVEKISAADYNKSIKEALDFLQGRNVELQKNIAAEMDEASRKEDYEKAAMLRDKIKNLSYIQTEGDNHIPILHNVDVIAVVLDAGIACISVSFYRFGHFYGHKLFFYNGHEENGGEEVLSAFLSSFYQNTTVPDEIILSQDVADIELLREAFAQMYGIDTKITIATKGPKKTLMEKAINSATEGLRHKIQHDGVGQKIYEEIRDLFHLAAVPKRIEIYDNSHIMGTSAVGAYVVATPKGFSKREYRAYNVENKVGDDYAMLREVLTRRLGKLVESAIPDLLLIDGGKGQLSTAIHVMQELGLNIPIVAISKGPDRNAGREIFHLTSGEELTFERNKPLMKYLQILRDEAHKFAITCHRKKRARAMTLSSLDDITDIGPTRKKALLAHFGSVEAIKSASTNEIAKVPGISKAIAERVKSAL